MRKRKSSYNSYIDPKLFLQIIVFIIIFWILARPLKGIGENIYLYLGSITNNAYTGITKSKSQAEKLIRSERLAKKQTKFISSLKIKNQLLLEQNNEVKELRDVLKLKQHISYKSFSASVIGRSVDNWHKQLIIDKGLDEGIKLGDSVLTSRGIVGQIVEIGKKTSIVELISDPSYRLGCKLQNENIYGILSGKTSSIGVLEFIPIGTNVKVGDLLVTSGISSEELKPTYPAGHPIGKVIYISKKKSKSSDLYIEVLLSEKLNTLSEVLIFSPN